MRAREVMGESIDDIELLRQVYEDIRLDDFTDGFACLMRAGQDPGRANDRSNTSFGQYGSRESHLTCRDTALAHVVCDELNQLIAGHRVDTVLQLLECLTILKRQRLISRQDLPQLLQARSLCHKRRELRAATRTGRKIGDIDQLLEKAILWKMVQKIEQRVVHDRVEERSRLLRNHVKQLRLMNDELQQERFPGTPVQFLETSDCLSSRPGGRPTIQQMGRGHERHHRFLSLRIETLHQGL